MVNINNAVFLVQIRQSKNKTKNFLIKDYCGISSRESYEKIIIFQLISELNEKQEKLKTRLLNYYPDSKFYSIPHIMEYNKFLEDILFTEESDINFNDN